MKLSECRVGDRVYVDRIDSCGDIKRRFLDIGLSYGTEVSVLYKSICGGIKAYLIRNSLIGIRDSDASNIVVRYDYE